MEAIRQKTNNQLMRKKLINVRTMSATDYLFRSFFFLGLNIPKNYRNFYITYSLVINSLVTVCMPLVFTISFMNIIVTQSELKDVLTSLHYTIDVWGCSLKTIIMAFCLKSLKSAELVLEKLDKRCTTPQEEDHVNRIVKFGRRLSVLYTMVYGIFSAITFCSSLQMGRPPYSLYNPFFNWRDSRLFLLIQSLIEYTLINVMCLQDVVADVYPVIYVCILRTHLQISIERIEKLASKDPCNWSKNTEELKMCIKDHKNLLEIYNTISPVISKTIFIQFTITAAIIGSAVLNLLYFAPNFSSRLGLYFYITATSIEIFPLCYYSECLLADSERFAQAIFHSNWIEQDVSYRKMVLHFMHHSQQRMQLMAGKIFPISLNTFMGIAKFSFTLYTFIKEMGIKEKLQLN